MFIMFTKEFWKDAAERVASTFVQVLIPVLTVDGISGLADKETLSIVAGTTLLALLKVLAAGLKSDTVSPASVVSE